MWTVALVWMKKLTHPYLLGRELPGKGEGDDLVDMSGAGDVIEG